jgi:hypothetical protein
MVVIMTMLAAAENDGPTYQATLYILVLVPR